MIDNLLKGIFELSIINQQSSAHQEIPAAAEISSLKLPVNKQR